MVENDCEDEFNILDSDADDGTDFVLHSLNLNDLSSPISERKAKMVSSDNPMLQMDMTPDSNDERPSGSEKPSAKSKSASPFPSRENSCSELVLSSRVEKLTPR